MLNLLTSTWHQLPVRKCTVTSYPVTCIHWKWTSEKFNRQYSNKLSYLTWCSIKLVIPFVCILFRCWIVLCEWLTSARRRSESWPLYVLTLSSLVVLRRVLLRVVCRVNIPLQQVLSNFQSEVYILHSNCL